MNVKSFWIRATLIVILIFTSLNLMVTPAYAQVEFGPPGFFPGPSTPPPKPPQPPKPPGDQEKGKVCKQENNCEVLNMGYGEFATLTFPNW